ncbi:MAG TPA: helix-hairpin-helix domain-containing protein, partial [Crocinitomix sp.]|nr:helix-hairpin-helix domain-containing protein [Crocinitomix sp.]
MKNLLLLISFLCIMGKPFAQEEERDKIIERRIEFIGENIENSDIDLTTYLEDLYYFFDNPINLNQTTFDELSKLLMLTDKQIYDILNYRKKYGEILSLYELSAIESLNEATIEMILPFVGIQQVKQDNFNLKKALRYGKHETFFRYQRILQTKAGYTEYPDSVLEKSPNKVYTGSPDKLYTRYRYTYKDKLSWGITAEKDAGEEFFRGSNKQGFDFYSAHIMLSNIGKINKVV